MISKFKNLDDKYINLLDQGLISIVNFGATLAFLKFADISVSSEYVLTYSYSIAAYFIISLLISAPILVFFSKKWKIFARSYFLSSIFITILINLIVAVMLFFFLEKQVASVSFLQFFLLCLGITLFDVLKKFVFAVKGSLLRYGLASTLILNLIFFGLAGYLRNEFTLNKILLVYNLSFFTANALLIFFILKNEIFKNKKDGNKSFGLKFPKKIFMLHFQYSKWLLVGGLAFWGYTQGIYIVATYYEISDLMIAKVRLIQNLVGVFSILMLTLENYYMPLFSKEAFAYNLSSVQGKLKGVYKENYKKIIFLFLLSIPIGLGMYEFLYSEKYGSGILIFLSFIFVQFLLVSAKPLSIALKSVEFTKPFFTAQIAAVLVMLLTLAGLAGIFEGNSLVVAFVCANTAYAIYIFGFYYLKMQKNKR